MTRDDIVRIAQEAAIMPPNWGATENQWRTLHDFAALVAAAEREKVAEWMMQRSYATGHGDTIEDLLKELEWQIAENWTNALVKGVEGEREACAQLCERMARRTEDIRRAALEMAADAIRARGKE